MKIALITIPTPTFTNRGAASALPYHIIKGAGDKARFEGFGRVLCEASVCAIPQVSYCCESGSSEIIENHKSGILVRRVGDINGLALALGELMSSEDMRRRMGQCADRLSHRFDLPEIVGQWRELLDALANQ